MIQEMTRAHYRGVRRSGCNERIPVPTKTALLYEELKQGEVSDSQDTNPRAFTLRCKACHEDGVYAMEAIQEFEGPPRVRALKS
jgi:hypothetical protein